MPLPLYVAGGVATGAGFHAAGRLFDWFNDDNTKPAPPAASVGAPAAQVIKDAGEGGIAISKGAALLITGGVLFITWLALK